MLDMKYKSIIQKGSYDEYVEGKYWELLSRFDFPSNQKEDLVKHAINRLKVKSNYKYSLKLGLYKFICSTNNALILNWLKHEKSALIQAFVLPYVPIDQIQKNKYIEFLKVLLTQIMR